MPTRLVLFFAPGREVYSVYSVIRTDICTWVSFKQISGESVGEVKVVADMHQRKAEMARQSEAFIALPGARYSDDFLLSSPIRYFNITCLQFVSGGYGTMEELLEMITWCQLGIHDKRVSTLIHIYRSTGLIDVYTHGYLANQQQALFF